MTHEEKLNNICDQVKAHLRHNKPVKIIKDQVSHFVPNPKDESYKLPKIDIKGMNNLLEIDAKEKTCTAEPGISFSDLVQETLKYGLIPYTVPELKGITIGGAVSGCSLESMSYRYGGFHDKCLEYEVVTGNGLVLTCSRDVNKDVFEMIHGSYGTLGILTKIKFRLLPAKPFVKMRYLKFDNFHDFNEELNFAMKKSDYDFIDGIIHSPSEHVLCLGTMVEDAPYTSSYDWLNIYHESTRKKTDDFLKISDYFFRYDTECHWITKTIPPLTWKPVRFLTGKIFLGSTNLIKWSNRLRPLMKMKRRPEVVVDVFIPSKKINEFYNWYEKDYAFYPLWIVPYKAPEIYPWINDEYAKNMEGDFLIDAAVYGKKNTDPKIDYSEVLEKKTIELGGIKTLISRNHFTEEDFWKVYNKENYTAAKSKTDPKNLFNNLYTKMNATQ